MNAPLSALAIANYFLDMAKKAQVGLTPMKIQKLIYFAHGWHLAIHKKPLIDEPIQAWDYGPVVSSVYHEFKKFGGQSIEGFGTDLDFDQEALITPRVPMDDVQTIALLNKVWSVYGKYSGVQLSNLTHEENSAWSNARASSEGARAVVIPDETIATDFVSKMVAKTAQ
jgi:uncharacterized phage-associated protein